MNVRIALTRALVVPLALAVVPLMGGTAAAAGPVVVDVAATSADSTGHVWRPDVVSLVAAVTQDSVPITSGSVVFLAAGRPVAVDGDGSDGWTASVASDLLPLGQFGVTARWVDGSASASSAATLLTVVAGPDVTRSAGPVQTTLPTGTFVFSSPFGGGDPNAPGSSPDNPFPLAEARLDPTGSCYYSVTPLPQLTLTDTRAGQYPFTLSASASDLVNDAAGSSVQPGESINSQNVGLSVSTVEANYADTSTVLLPAGSDPSSSANISLFDTSAAPCLPSTATGTDGLGGGVAHPFVHVAQGTGTIKLSTTITIAAPTSTVDGTYRGTVTFTFLGS